MGTLAYLICVAVARFAVLAQPAGAQGTNTTLPLAYPGMASLVFCGQMVIPCGMDRGVVPLAPVAPSTHHHGSM